MFNELFNLLSNYDFDNIVSDELDLSKNEDVEKTHKLIKSIKDDKLACAMLSFFMEDEDIDEFLNNADALVDDIHAKKTQENKQLDRKITDKSVQPAQQTKIERPSVNIDVNAGLQIHKLVQEYIDTMVKPYSTGILDSKEINDAYAGLYEFACWIYKK